MNTMKRNMLWNAFGNIVYMGCQWLLTILVANLGGLADAGILSVAMSVSATFQTIALFGIRSYQVSDLEERYSDTCYVGFRGVTCLVALLSCLLLSLVNHYYGTQLIAIVLFMVFRLAESYSDVLHGIAQKKDRLDIAGKSFAIKGVGLLLSFLGGYHLSGQLNVGLMLMMGFSVTSTILYDLPAVRRLASFQLNATLRSYFPLAKEALPLCIYLFLYATLSTIPKLILEKECGEVALGAYSSIFAPAMLLQAATGYLYNPFTPSFAQSAMEKDAKGFWKLMRNILLLIFAIAAIVFLLAWLLGDFVLILMFGEKIREYVSLLMPILIVNFSISCLGLLCMLIVILRDFRTLLVGCSAGAMLCFVFTKPFLHKFGINGASYGLILATLIACAIIAVGIFVHLVRFSDRRKKLK